MILEPRLHDVEVMVEDLENPTLRVSEVRGSWLISISGKSDIQSDVSTSVIVG